MERDVIATTRSEYYDDYSYEYAMASLRMSGFELNSNCIMVPSENPSVIAIHDRGIAQAYRVDNFVYHYDRFNGFWNSPEGSNHRYEILERNLISGPAIDQMFREIDYFSKLAESEGLNPGVVFDVAHFAYCVDNKWISMDQFVNIVDALSNHNVALHVSAYGGEISNDRGRWAKHMPFSRVRESLGDEHIEQREILKYLLQAHPNALTTLEGPHDNYEALQDELRLLSL